MHEAIHYRQQIRNRLAEKRKFSSARTGIVWLLMVASGLVMLTLLRISILFADRPLTVPTTFIAIVPVLGAALFALRKTKVYTKENELALASAFASLALAIVAFSLLLLIAGTYEWYVELKHLPRFTAAGFIVFLAFYLVNAIIALFNLLSVYKNIKTFQVHSMNMDSLNKTFLYWTFLFIIHSVFILIVM